MGDCFGRNATGYQLLVSRGDKKYFRKPVRKQLHF